jgi:benzoate transport
MAREQTRTGAGGEETGMERDPRAILADAPMSAVQIVAVVITMALNALDGFDVLAISFASPGIAAEWGIDRGALGIVLAMELIGMAVGSVVLGGVTDRIGRRPMILLCLCVMAMGMLMVPTTNGVASLSLWRIFTGLGIGGMLAATNATVAEYANSRSRSLCVSLMAVGYPLGAVLGGAVVAQLLQGGDWRIVFHFGGIVTLALVPIVWFFLPETIPFLCHKRPRGALDKINRLLARMGQGAVAVLPPVVAGDARKSVADLFRPGLLVTTLLVTLAYFAHIATFYFILKWVPKIVVDMGFAPSSAAGVLVWANVGGATGGVLLGLLATRLPLRPLTIAALVGAVLMVSWFGRGQADLVQLSLVVGIAGFFTNAGVVGLYAIFAQAFPTHVRATGTGFAIGVGRGGAAFSPILAGFLFQAGFGLQGVAMAMASGAAIAAVALFLLPAASREQSA